MSKPEPFGKKVRIDRRFPEDLKTHFATNIVVQHDPGTFYISFFEMFPPLVIADNDAERIKILNSLDSVDAKCVSRIVVTPDKMREFIDALEENYKGYQELIKKLSKA